MPLFTVELDDLDFGEDIGIDKTNLIGEWEDQPNLYAAYGAAAAFYVKEAKRKETEYKVVKAELWKEAAEGGEDIIGMKPTVDNIRAWVYSHPDYKKYRDMLAEAEEEAEIAKTAMYAFTQRKSALQELGWMLQAEKNAENENTNIQESVSENTRRKMRQKKESN